MIGITEDPYDANVTGNPNKCTGSPAATNAEKFGCNNIDANTTATKGEHLNFCAAV